MVAPKPDEQAVCARCGAAIDPADHYEIRAASADGRASLCRLEHVVAWILRGAPWQFERPWELAPDARSAQSELLLFRARNDDRLELEFGDIEELKSWALKGGFWSPEQ